MNTLSEWKILCLNNFHQAEDHWKRRVSDGLRRKIATSAVASLSEDADFPGIRTIEIVDYLDRECLDTENCHLVSKVMTPHWRVLDQCKIFLISRFQCIVKFWCQERASDDSISIVPWCINSPPHKLISIDLIHFRHKILCLTLI